MSADGRLLSLTLHSATHGLTGISNELGSLVGLQLMYSLWIILASRLGDTLCCSLAKLPVLTVAYVQQHMITMHAPTPAHISSTEVLDWPCVARL